MGLTTIEAENALAKSIVEYVNGQKDKKGANAKFKLVLKEKALAVKKSGILEYYPADQTAANVGGLENSSSGSTCEQAFRPKPRLWFPHAARPYFGGHSWDAEKACPPKLARTYGTCRF